MDLLLSSIDRTAIRQAISEVFDGVDVWLANDIDELLTHGAPFFATIGPCATPGLPTVLDIARWPGDAQGSPGEAAFGEMLLTLSAALSRRLQCDVLCDAGRLAPSRNPHWSVLWRCGDAWLVDDSEVDGDPPGPPVLVRRLDHQTD